MKFTKVFIVGVPRSGTTLLATILENHKDVFLEPKAIGPSFVNLKEETFNVYYKNGFDNIPNLFLAALDNFPRLKRFFSSVSISDLHPNDFCLPNLIDKAISVKLKKNLRKVWVDKCPPMIFKIPELNLYFPDAKFIHVIRDGRAVALSLNKRQHMNIYLAANYWKVGVFMGRYFGSSLNKGRYLEVRYEDILRNPVATIARVTEFLGLDFDNEIINLERNPITSKKNAYVRNTYDISKLESWKNDLPIRTIREMEKIEGDLLEAFGYNLIAYDGENYVNLTPFWIIILKIFDNIKFILRRRQISMIDRELVEIKLPLRIRIRKALGDIFGLIFSREMRSLLANKKHIIY